MLCKDLYNEKIKLPDMVYDSIGTDNSKQVYVYVRVKDNKIIAIGEERIRDGGWYWFSE